MARYRLPKKDPDSTKDYQFYWADWLAGDTIATATFSVDSASGVTISSQSRTTATATAWLTGGTAGKVALLQCRITTASGRTDDRTAEVPIGGS